MPSEILQRHTEVKRLYCAHSAKSNWKFQKLAVQCIHVMRNSTKSRIELFRYELKEYIVIKSVCDRDRM